MSRLIILLMPLFSVAFAAELVTLSADNFAEYAPTGKEADAIIGDYVLRNDRIIAAVADPTLLSGRSAQRWSIRNIAGTLIDLTRRDAPNDQLTAYYPGPIRFKPDAPTDAHLFVDERLAHRQPGRQPQQGHRVSLTLPAYEMKSGKMLQELAKLPSHLRGAPTVFVEVTFTLEDGWDYLQIEVTYTNPTQRAEPLTLTSALRTDGEFQHLMLDGRLVATNPWWRQAYAVLPVDHTLKRSRGSKTHSTLTCPPATLAPGETYTFTRRLMPGRDLAAVQQAISQLTKQLTEMVTISLKDPAGPLADVPIEIYRQGTLWAESHSDAGGTCRLNLPAGRYQLIASPFGRPGTSRDLVINDSAVTISLDVPAAANARFTIADPQGNPLAAKIAFVGAEETPDPMFFPASGELSVRNLRYTVDGTVEQELAPGTYDIIISHGPEYSVHRQRLTLKAGDSVTTAVVLQRIIDTTGWISAETHNHSTLSGYTEIFYVYPYSKDPTVDGDSIASTRGRVINLLAEQIEFAVPTEHNFITDYAPILQDLGAQGRLATCPGIGLTAGRRHTVNHQNVWPVIPILGKQDGGAPQRPEHVSQIDWMSEWYDNAPKLIQVSEPRPQKSTITSHVSLLDLVDLEPIIERQPMPGRDNRILDWLDKLSHGYRLPAVANEGRFDNFHGSGGLRNYVASATDDPASIDPDAIREAMATGQVVMTTGPFLRVALSMAGKTAIPGDSIVGTQGTLNLHLGLPDSVTIDRLQVLVNGRQYGSGLTRPPLTKSADIQYPIQLERDAYIIVVASGTGPNLRGGSRQTVTHVAVSNPIWVDTTGDGYSPHSPLHDAVATRLDFIEPPLARPNAPPGRVRLHLTNRGPAPATDTVALQIIPPEAARIVGETTQSYTLPHQGAEANVEWEIVFNDDYLAKNFPLTTTYNNIHTFGISTPRSGTFPGRKAAATWMRLDNAALSLPPMNDLAAVKDALAPAVVYPIKGRGTGPLGDIRFGVAGDFLTIHARVKDAQPRHHPIVWEGSCLEIFGSMPGRHRANTKAGLYYSIHQVYLVPALGDKPATAWRRPSETDETIIPAPEIQLTSQPTDSGYELSALIPLSMMNIHIDHIPREVHLSSGFTPVELMGLIPQAGRFLIESRINTHLTTHGKKVRGTIFGTPAPHVDHLPFGHMRLDGSATGQLQVLTPLSATPGGPPAHVRLTLRNTSDQPIDDSLTLTIDPPSVAAVRSPATIPVAIPIGGSFTHDFQIDLKHTTMASGLHLVIPRSPRGQLVRIPSPILPISNRQIPHLHTLPLRQISDKLTQLTAYPITADGQAVAEVHFAISGSALILNAHVKDHQVKHGTRPWKGSLVEVFATSPTTDTIHQIFLQPGTGELPPRALLPIDGKQLPTAEVAVQSQLTPTGYHLQASIPLTLLGKAHPQGTIKLEFQISTTFADGKLHYGTLFNSKRAYQDHTYYGRFDIPKAPTE